METQDPSTVRFDGVHCSMTIERHARGVAIVTISGIDIGEFGDAPMQALDDRIAGAKSVQLFVDARDVAGASIDVSGEWAQWLGDHRSQFSEVSMLAGSRFIEITADFVRRFSDLQGIMRIYTDPMLFDAAINQAVGR